MVDRILIRAHSLFTGREVISPAAIIVAGSVVEAIGAPLELEGRGPFANVLGTIDGHYVTPGFVNGHHHNLRPNRPRLLESPLELSLLQLRRRRLPAMTVEEERDHTLWGASALLRTGVTTVVDCFSADPTRPDFGLEVSLDAYLESGMRAAVCIRCSDRINFSYEDDEAFWGRLPSHVAEVSRAKSKPFDADRFFDVSEGVARDYDGRDGRIRVGYGPTGEQWCSDDLLARIGRIARDRGAPAQIHLLESPFQLAAAQNRYHSSPVQRLHDAGFIGPSVSFAHGIWVTDQDIQVIRDAGSVVVNNPASNLRFGNGIAPVARMLALGCPVGLGLDANGFEPGFDMIREMRLAMLLQRLPGWNGSQMSPLDILTIATHGGAAAAAMPEIGLLADGRPADLLIIDRDPQALSPYIEADLAMPEALVTAGEPAAIQLVMVAGRVVMERGSRADAAFAELTARVRESVARFLPLLEDADAEFRLLAPYLDDYFHGIDLSGYGIDPGDRTLKSVYARAGR